MNTARQAAAAYSPALALQRSQMMAQAIQQGFTASVAAMQRTERYAELRERYARGWISLGDFEARVEVLLRRGLP